MSTSKHETTPTVNAEEIYKTQPDWSPDGSSIAYRQITVRGSQNSISIWRIDLADSECTNLTSDYEGIHGAPVWSPDGNWIAFTSDRAGNFDVWIMRPDGSSLTNLTESNLNLDAAPVWSPDGRFLAFESFISSGPKSDIRLADLAGNRVINLTGKSDLSWNLPTWSPNSDSLVAVARVATFSAVDAIPAGVWKVDVATQVLTNLIEAEHRDIFAQLSPSGAFLALVNEGLNLWLFDFESSNLINLTQESGRTGGRPVWSPDSKKLAFYSRTNENIDIWLMNFDGSELVNLTHDNLGRDEFPDWSPNGSEIAFESSPELVGNSDIWIIRSDGSDLRKLSCSIP